MLRLVLVFGITFIGLYYAVSTGFGALLFYLWVGYFRPLDWVWDDSLLRPLNLSFTAGILVLARAPGSGVKFRMDFRSFLLLLLLVHSLVSTLISPYSAYAWPFWIEFAKALIITYMIASHSVDIAKYRQVLFVIALSLGFEGAKQGWVQLLTNPGGKNINEFPLLGDNNGVAVGMIMLVGLFIVLAQTAQTARERWFHRFFMVGVAYRAISTYSRGGFLSAAVLATLYVLRSKQKAKGALGMVVVAGVILSALPAEFWDRMSTIQVAQTEESVEAMSASESADNASSTSRLHFWAVGLKMAEANPFFGVGLNAFNKAYDRYDFLEGGYGRGRSVHSSWFGIVAETGYVGFALYVTIMLLAFVTCQQVARKSKKGQAAAELYYYAVAIQTGLAVAFVGSSFVAWQYCEMLWHFVGLSMGLRSLANAPQAAAAVTAPMAVTAPAPFRPMVVARRTP